jgi:hypothetical protein
MDDYLKYTDNKEIKYAGKLDSVRVLSGKNRVVINGLLTSDPNINLIKIFYNQRHDSILLDIKRSSGIDTINVPISLPEGSHNFEIIAFDNKGNSSVKVSATGRSYGPIYEETLFSRVIKNAEKNGNDATIDLYPAEETSPFSIVRYTNTQGASKSITVPKETTQVTLKDFKSMSKVSIQTFFLPDTAAIDTFSAPLGNIVVAEDVTSFYLKNAGTPIVRNDNGTGKWGTPKDWLYSANVLNQNNNTAGGWSTDAGGTIHFESKDWGGEGLVNGKMYQKFNLAPGTYELTYFSDGSGGEINSNFLAVKGSILPDINSLDGNSDILARYQANSSNVSGTKTITFSITETTPIAVGWVVTTGSSTWLHFNSIKLRLVGQ